MPAINFNLYDKFRENNFDGNAINFESPTGNGIKCAIVVAGYAPNQNTDNFWADVNPGTNEVVGTGYTAGGNLLANGIVILDGAGLASVDLDDPNIWAQTAGGFADGDRVIIYHDTGTEGTSKLIGYSESFGSGQGNLNADFFVELGIAGLFTSTR